MELMLRRIKRTSPGLDNIPYCVYKKCSFELANVVAHVFDLSFIIGSVTTAWLSATVTPIPKIPKSLTPSDYSPISVTPILSRLAEKFVVYNWVRPAFTPNIINDQFAFRPTGSTTCALTYLMHHICNFFKTNDYVRILLID